MTLKNKLSNKLSLNKDLRVSAITREGGTISEFFRIFRSRFTDLVLLNLIFLVFLIPFFVIYFWFVPSLVNSINSNLNLLGNLGLGYPGINTDTTQATCLILGVYQFAFLLMIPCFSLAGIGASGLFFCTRNLMWQANTKTFKHFLRGIKMHWWKFLIIFTILGGFVALFGYVILLQLQWIVLKTAAWWSYLVIVICSLLMLAVAVFFINICPMIVHYKFSFKDLVVNTSILSIITPLADLSVLLALALLFLSFVNFLGFIIIIFMGFVGFSFYFLMFTALGQFKYDGIINPLYEQSKNPIKGKEKNNKSDSNTAGKKHSENNNDIVKNNNSSNKKGINAKNNYRSSYKKKKLPNNGKVNKQTENDSMKIEIIDKDN